VNGLWLLLRARRLIPVAAFITAVEVLVLIFGDLQFNVGQHNVQSVPVAVLAPVLMSCALALLTFTPQFGTDSSAARDLRPILLGVLILSLVIAEIGLVLTTGNLTGDLTTWSACRNLAGFYGLALIAAAVLGEAWFWAIPVLAAVIPLTGLTGGGLIRIVTWPLASDRSGLATRSAAALLVVGFLFQAMTRRRFVLLPTRPRGVVFDESLND
jgi:hypothetical protein